MNILSMILPLTEQVPAPEDVKAGWVAFGIFLALAAAVVFLGFSLRKHLKRVDFDEKDNSSREPGEPQQGTSTG